MRNKKKSLENLNKPVVKTMLISFLVYFIISFVFSIIISVILFFLKIEAYPIYGLVFFFASLLISFIYILANKKKTKDKKSDNFIYWLLILLIYLGFGALFLGLIILVRNTKTIYSYDLILLGIFCILSFIFLWKRRDNLKREGVMYLYRTKIGIKLIDYIGSKYKKTLRVLSFVAVICGYILMASMVYFLYKLIQIYLFEPRIVQAIKIPPLMPLIPYVPEIFGVSFLKPFYFTYWIIAIAVIAVFHEFSHGIFARRYGIKIKTTGFGFLGPFLAAFVEPDEKQMQKKPKFQQIAVLSAGTFANIILTVLFFVLLVVFFILAYAPAGATFDGYPTSDIKVDLITNVGGINVTSLTAPELLNTINKMNIQDSLTVGKGKNSMNLTIVDANGSRHLIPIEYLKNQLEQNLRYVRMYRDLPAIRAGIDPSEAIIKIDNKKIKDSKVLSDILKNYKPGDKIKITTKESGGKINEYEIVFAENPNEKGRPMIGIASNIPGAGFFTKIFNFLNLFREPGTYYEPRFNEGLTVFIYNLIWWLVLINFSVAIINMWPVAIFDGGRVFLLTVWAITGSEKVGKLAFKALTYIILGALALLMYGYFISFVR